MKDGSTHLHCAVLASRFQPQHSQSLGNNHSLLLVVWWWDTFEELESFKSGSPPGALMRGHAPDRSVENFGRGTVMEGARLFRVDDVAFVEKIMVTKLKRQLNMKKWEQDNATRTLFLKKLPEMLISSHLTTTIFWPERICFEIIEASRPRR